MKTFKEFLHESEEHTVKVYGQGLGIHSSHRQKFKDTLGNQFHGSPDEAQDHFRKLHPSKSIIFSLQSKKRK